MKAKLANLNGFRSTSEPVVMPEIEPAQASPSQPILRGATSLVPVHDLSVVPTLPPARPFNDGQDGGQAALGLGNPEDVAFHPQELQASVGGQPPFQQPDSGHYER